MEDGLVFNDIFLSARNQTRLGQLSVRPGGILWKEYGEGKKFEVNRHEILGLTWMEDVFYQFMLEAKDGAVYSFVGFQEEEFTVLNDFLQCHVEMTLKKADPPVVKRNYIEVYSNRDILTFKVGVEQAFQVSLMDIDRTWHRNKPETLIQDAWLTVTTCHPPPQISPRETALVVNDNSSANSSVATFKEVHVLFSGYHNVELDRLSMRFHEGKTNFEIAYTKIVCLFMLPMVTKENEAFTIIVGNLEQPFQYDLQSSPHLIMVFNSNVVAEVYPNRIEHLLGADQRDNLEASFKGPSYEVFSSIFCVLAEKEIIRPGCCNAEGGYGVHSSLLRHLTVCRGTLYSLEKEFFFLLIRPLYIAHEEIEYVEFKRRGVKGSRMYSSCFDLAMKLTNGEEHVFSRIEMTEYEILLQFISMKGLKIRNRLDPGHIIYGTATTSEASGEERSKRERML